MRRLSKNRLSWFELRPRTVRVGDWSAENVLGLRELDEMMLRTELVLRLTLFDGLLWSERVFSWSGSLVKTENMRLTEGC